MAKIKQLLTLGIGVALCWALSHSLGPVPPLGGLINPFSGFWQNAEGKIPFSSENYEMTGVQDEVRILWDQNLIPHVYAKNLSDLYFAQGYLTASLRLWQMEFQTHFAAGRLSEIVGDRALAIDQFQRRIGMPWAAEQALEGAYRVPSTKLAMEAYSNGINAYISQLEPKDYPLEYKILDYKPEPWSPYKTALFLKYMAWDLSGER